MGDRATRDASVGRTNAHLMLAAPAVALLGGAAMGFMAGGAVGALTASQMRFTHDEKVAANMMKNQEAAYEAREAAHLIQLSEMLARGVQPPAQAVRGAPVYNNARGGGRDGLIYPDMPGGRAYPPVLPRSDATQSARPRGEQGGGFGAPQSEEADMLAQRQEWGGADWAGPGQDYRTSAGPRPMAADMRAQPGLGTSPADALQQRAVFRDERGRSEAANAPTPGPGEGDGGGGG